MQMGKHMKLLREQLKLHNFHCQSVSQGESRDKITSKRHDSEEERHKGRTRNPRNPTKLCKESGV